MVKGTAMEETHHISGKKYFQIITTQEDGKNFEMMEFLLEQPEVHSTRTGERDFFPKDYVADPAEQKKEVPKKKIKKKSKKKKKKRKNKKQKKASKKKEKKAAESEKEEL